MKFFPEVDLRGMKFFPKVDLTLPDVGGGA